MKVKELIQRLQVMDPEKEVVASIITGEGRKVYSTANPVVEVEEFTDEVTIWREI